MNEMKDYTEKMFEDIKHIDENGNEYWSARELQNGKTREELDEFFLIPVENSNMDKIKTLCNYLLHTMGLKVSIYNEIDRSNGNYRRTSKSKLEVNGEENIKDDNELLLYTMNQIELLKNNNQYDRFLKTIAYSCGTTDFDGNFTFFQESLRYKLIQEYMPSIIKDIIQKYMGGCKC